MSKRAISGIMLTLLLTCMLYTILNVRLVACWSNGGYSDDPSNPDYGTHDWIAEHALDWLPEEEKRYIVDNLAAYLYGTELPDNGIAPDGIGDTAKHHIYYWSNESLQDDASAVRASVEYYNALNFLKSRDFPNASKTAGIMSHYIVDVAVFGHVMGAGTDWGAEVHHSDYENYVNQRTDSYDDEFNVYLSFDGELSIISAYDAAKELAYDTTFDVDGDLTCVWMDQNYNWSDPVFKNRCGESLNLAVNYLTDVLHTLYLEAASVPLTVSISPLSASILVGESVTFTSTVSGGYTPYNYQWYLNSNPVSGATSDTWTFTPTEAGIYYVYLKVTDAEGNTAQSDTARVAVAAVPVGGYSYPINKYTLSTPIATHIALTAILTAIFITIKRKTKRKHSFCC